VETESSESIMLPLHPPIRHFYDFGFTNLFLSQKTETKSTVTQTCVGTVDDTQGLTSFRTESSLHHLGTASIRYKIFKKHR
jgi:hypothetical protein